MEWLEQLAFRVDVYRFLLCWEENPKLKFGSFRIDDLLRILMEKPVVHVDRLNTKGWGLQPFSAVLGVRSLNELPERVVSCWDQRSDPRYSMRAAVTNSAVFVVDLDAPNTLLLDQFERELKRARKSRRIVKRDPFRTHRWFKIGLLPYVDIRLWAQRNGVGPIPDAVLARKILGAEKTGLEYMIGMVTKKQAESYLRLGTTPFMERVRLMHAAKQ